jgi:hypothetical protein
MYLSSELRTSTAQRLVREIPEITDPSLVAALEEVE